MSFLGLQPLAMKTEKDKTRQLQDKLDLNIHCSIVLELVPDTVESICIMSVTD